VRPESSSTDGAQVMTRVGAFTDRDAWTAEGRCRIERALELVGTRSAMIILREAFLGGRRFDEIARRTGLSEAVAAKRLKQLVDDGLLTQQPYREAGSRTRYEYVLTERGRSLFPILVALLHWGDALDEAPGPIQLTHAGCGEPIEIDVRCRAGHPASVNHTNVSLTRAPQ
jgi:DNA-binding HxlR family transcriptional regulator